MVTRDPVDPEGAIEFATRLMMGGIANLPKKQLVDPSPFGWGGGALIRDGGVMTHSTTAASDPSARDYAGTSPLNGEGLLQAQPPCAITIAQHADLLDLDLADVARSSARAAACAPSPRPTACR